MQLGKVQVWAQSGTAPSGKEDSIKSGFNVSSAYVLKSDMESFFPVDVYISVN